MNKFETECNKYKNYISYLNLKPVYNTFGLFNKYNTVGILIRTFWSLEMTTLKTIFTINYRILYSKNDTPLSYMGILASEFVKEDEINIVYSSDKELETNQVINEGIAFLREFKSIMDDEDIVLRNKQLEVFIKKHKIEEDFR